MPRKKKLPRKKKFKKFLVTVVQEIEIDEDILKEAAKPEWQEYICEMDELAVVQHIGFNLVSNALGLTQIDGFADRKDDEARVVGRADCEVEPVR